MGQVLLMIGAIVLTLPGVALRLLGIHIDPLTDSLIYALTVVGAAFLLSWAAEVAQHDIPRSLALTILALIAVLPEYAVDMYLAWRAADDPVTYGPLALVNMTGANRQPTPISRRFAPAGRQSSCSIGSERGGKGKRSLALHWKKAKTPK